LNRLQLEGQEFIVVSWPRHQREALTKLTQAETEVLTALFEGHTNQAIANLRGTSLRTVNNQVSALFKKLGVRSRSELARLQARP